MTEVKYNIKEALKHYRYLAAFIENAVDALDWYVADYKISSQIRAITESRMETMAYKSHMDAALETYRRLCEDEGNVRPYNVIMRKFVDPSGGADGRGKPYTNEQLADLFDCSIDTVKRDINRSYCKLRILFFGIHGCQPEKGA
jgi:hypothetical protein